MRGRLMVGHLPLKENILGSNPSPAAILDDTNPDFLAKIEFSFPEI